MGLTELEARVAVLEEEQKLMGRIYGPSFLREAAQEILLFALSSSRKVAADRCDIVAGLLLYAGLDREHLLLTETQTAAAFEMSPVVSGRQLEANFVEPARRLLRSNPELRSERAAVVIDNYDNIQKWMAM
jgi:hypothetical protein